MTTNILYEAVLVNHTPAMIGGANRGWININGSIDYPRPTDIAGKTRWWLRSILSAGIYEEYGYHLPIKTLDRLAEKIMGRIKPVGLAEASKIIIELRPEDPLEYISTLICLKRTYRNKLCKLANCYNGGDTPRWHRIHQRCLNNLLSDNGYCPDGEEACCALASPRVLLTVMGKSIDEAIGLLPIPPEKIKLRVKIRRRLGANLNEKEERLIGLALGLALYASGIGKAQTRGYGKLKPVEVKTHNTVLSETIEELYNYLIDREGWRDIVGISTEYSSDLIRDLIKEEEQIIGMESPKNSRSKAYTLHRKLVKAWSSRCISLYNDREYMIYCEPRNTWCTVAAINNAVLKKTMKIVLNRIIGEPISTVLRMHGYPIITMYLGMERATKKGGKTGYFFDQNRRETIFSRLLSPMFFTVIGSTVSAILFYDNEAFSILEKENIVKYRGKIGPYRENNITSIAIYRLLRYIERCRCRTNNVLEGEKLCLRDVMKEIYDEDIMWEPGIDTEKRVYGIGSLVARILGLNEVDL